MEEAFEEGRGPHTVVEPVKIMIMSIVDNRFSAR
jgi:hypothetical protein